MKIFLREKNKVESRFKQSNIQTKNHFVKTSKERIREKANPSIPFQYYAAKESNLNVPYIHIYIPKKKILAT